MKSIVLIGAFALLIVLALGDVPQESSQDIAEASELGLLERETREARRKRRKGKGKKGKGKANGKGRKVRKGKGGKKSKGNGSRKSNKNNSGKKRKTSNKKASQPRQTSTPTPPSVPTSNVTKVFSGYRTATNRLRQIKRILKFRNQIEKKHEKAKTEFTSAAKALDEATDGGSFCNGSAANSSVTAKVLELNNCSNSAAAKCVVPNITQNGPNDLQACAELLDFSVNSTKNWLQNPSTATFPDVVYPDQDCIDNAKDNEANVKKAKDECVSSKEVGSFGSCSAILKKAAGLVLDCGKITDNPPPTTTAASSGRHRIFKFQQQLF